MTNSPFTPVSSDPRAARPRDAFRAKFGALPPPRTGTERSVAADRCYFCHDAPCITACPTSIDIPLFIRSDRYRHARGCGPQGPSSTQNILGGMCPRVCPTDDALRRGLRAREWPRGKTGRDRAAAALCHRPRMNGPAKKGRASLTRGAAGNRQARGGGGRGARGACLRAHRLAMHGHDVALVRTAKEKGGGLTRITASPITRRSADFAEADPPPGRLAAEESAASTNAHRQGAGP